MAASLITPELLRRLEQFQLLAARRAKSSAKGERRGRESLVGTSEEGPGEAQGCGEAPRPEGSAEVARPT